MERVRILRLLGVTAEVLRLKRTSSAISARGSFSRTLLSAVLLLASLSLPAYEIEKSYPARVYAPWGLLVFGRIPSSDLLQSVKASDVWLELEFAEQFPESKLHYTINGYGGYQYWHATKPTSEWVANDRTKILHINVGNERLGGHRSFLRHLRELSEYGGSLSIFVQSPHPMISSRLVIAKPEKSHGHEVAHVVIDKITPPGPVVHQPEISFEFHSPEGARQFECAINRTKFDPCTSPKIYSDLENGQYAFRVRAIDSDGKPGPVHPYRFRVRLPFPAVIITKVVPPEAVTTTDSISISYMTGGPGHRDDHRIICRLDKERYRWCRSPVEYSNLSEGEHVVEFRRLTWGHHLPWVKWLLRHSWFHRWFPIVYSPVYYHWKVDKQIPRVEWVSTPPSLTQATIATFSFIATKPSTFTCRLDNADQGSCESPVLLTGLSEGTHRFEVVALAGGFSSEPISHTWKVDLTPPVIEITSVNPQQNPTSLTELSLSYSVSEPAQVFCELDGQALARCQSPLWVTDLAEGTHHLTLWAKDGADNEGPAQSYSWTVDATSPLLTILMAFPERLPTRESRAVFELSSNEPSSLECSLDGETPWACDSHVELTGLAEGEHQFTVTSVDAAGNAGSPAIFQWQIDQTPPAVRITQVTPESTVTDLSDIEIRFEVSEPSSVTCELDLGGRVPCSSPYIASGLAEGRHVWVVRAEDLAGNQSEELTYRWEIHGVALVSITGTSPTGALVNQSSITIDFNSSNASGFVCRLDSGSFESCQSPAHHQGLVDGSHRFEVRGVNAFGEQGPPALHEWTIDSVAPEVTLTALVPSTSPTPETTMTVSFTASESAAFFCLLDTGVESACSSPWNIEALEQGEHLLSVFAVDQAGNRGPGATYQWVVDSPIPTVRITHVVPSESITSSRDITIEFASPNATSFLCSLDGQAPVACTSPVSYQALPDGTHEFSVVGVNAFGQSGEPARYGWAVDNVAPVVAFVSIVPSTSPTAETTLAVTFSSSEEATYVCRLDSGSEVPCTSPWQWNGLGQGTHRVSVAAIDRAGNRGADATHEWVIDIPTLPVTITQVVPADQTTQSRSISIFFVSAGASGFKCGLDGAALTVCTSPVTYQGLADGNHQFEVRAINSAGEIGDSATYAWAIDATAPVVALSVNPDESTTIETYLEAQFSANETAVFRCRLDSTPELDCSSPWRLTGLSEGQHSIAVYAIDNVGNRSEPATHQWSIDVVSPTVTITAVVPPEAVTGSSQVTVSFESSNATSFLCALDGGTAVTCTSPAHYTGVTEGSHRFDVWGVNSLGQSGAAASYVWSVDLTAPVVQIVSTDPSWMPTAQTSLTVNFTANETASFGCSLDQGPEISCSSPWTVSGLSQGTHTIAIVATDVVGNRSAPATYTWSIVETALTITLGPLARNITKTSATIEWETNLPATSKVFYGEGSAPTSWTSVENATLVTQHSVVLTDLKRFTVYSVYVVSVDRDGQEVISSALVFRTQR